MSVFRNLILAVTLLLAISAVALADDWQVGLGVKTNDGDFSGNGPDTGADLLIDVGDFGAELSLSRTFGQHWRLAGYYAYFSDDEDGEAGGDDLDLPPQALSGNLEAREQQLGANMQRLFYWSERWSPYLGLGVVYSRFEGKARIRFAEFDAFVNPKRENDWLYAGVAGIQYRFAQSYSAELEYQRIEFFDSDTRDGGDMFTLRLSYSF